MNVLRREPVWLYVLAAAPPLAGILNFYAGGIPLFKGHAAPILFTVAVSGLAVVFWLPFISRLQLSPLGVSAIVALGVVWASSLIFLSRDGNGIDFAAIAPFVIVTLTLLKSPNQDQVLRALQILAAAIVASSLIVLFAHLVSDLPSGFSPNDGIQRVGALTNLGIEWRWSGPFIHSNLAGPIGGAVMIIGLASRHLMSVILVVGGAVIMLLSQSRTGLISLLITLALWWLLRSWLRSGRPNPFTWVALAIFVGLVTVYIVTQAPTLSGRTSAWVDYFNLMVAEPLGGVGNTGVLEYLERNSDRVVDIAQPHAHNFLLDIGGRWGAPMMILSAAILVSSVLLGLRAARLGTQVGLALGIFVIIVGISEMPFSWSHASPLMMVFFLALSVSASAIGSVKVEADAVTTSPQTP